MRGGVWGGWGVGGLGGWGVGGLGCWGVGLWGLGGGGGGWGGVGGGWGLLFFGGMASLEVWVPKHLNELRVQGLGFWGLWLKSLRAWRF